MMEQMHLFDEPERIDNRFASYEEKIEHAKDVIRTAAHIADTYNKKPLVICYSGGKDSDLLLDIALKTGVEIEVLHSITTVDAPETNAFINERFMELEEMGIKTVKRIPMWKGEKTNMWKQIVERQMPPTRLMRYCCKVFKETGTPGRMCALGVRRDESVGRGGRSDFGLRTETKAQARFFSLDHTQKVFQDAQRIADENNKPVEEEDVYDCTMVSIAKRGGENYL